jgi:Uma2 family endonuclease
MNLALMGVPLPLRFRPETPMSDDELMRFCAANDVLRVERDANGEILVMTPAGGRTGRKNAYLTQVLGTWADQDGRGYAFDSNTGFTLPDGSMRSPDAAWVLKDRWDAMSEADQDRFSPLCPDFILELRSQSDRRVPLEEKMEQWIANGAQLAWLLDPTEQSVTIYRPTHSPETLHAPATVAADGILTGFVLTTARIWT